MASKSSIAIRRNAAIDRCKSAIRTLWGDEFELPLRHRDPSMLSATQLEAIADYLTCKAEGVSTKVEINLDSVPETMTVSVPMVSIVGETLLTPSALTIGSTKPRGRRTKAK